MRGLFRSFDREGVRYLLIGGQAAILYGAALFTQDLDVWIQPSRGKWAARILDRRMATHMEAARRYRRPVFHELRELRAAGRLLPEGLSVRDLVKGLR